jgi:hypothetical protein
MEIRVQCRLVGENKVGTLLGIYKLRRKTLTWCLGWAKRPEAFKNGDDQEVYVFERK